MYKQIIIARKDLNMSSGKLAAQVSHGSMAFLSWFIRNNVDLDGHVDGYIDEDILHNWIEGEFTKCVLQAKNKNQLLKAKTMAEDLGMVEGKDFWLIKDNCHTELEPEEDGKTLTVIGFRPMDSEIIDQIGRKYHLYMQEGEYRGHCSYLCEYVREYKKFYCIRCGGLNLRN